MRKSGLQATRKARMAEITSERRKSLDGPSTREIRPFFERSRIDFSRVFVSCLFTCFYVAFIMSFYVAIMTLMTVSLKAQIAHVKNDICHTICYIYYNITRVIRFLRAF